MQRQTEIVPLQESQIEAAGASMARAFFDDPIVAYMYPDETERGRLTPWHFRTFIRYGYLFGRVYTTSGQPDGTAVWFPPGETEMRGDRIEEVGLDKAADVLGAAAWERFSRVCDHVEQLHPLEVAGPHWYLPLLGVDTPRQRQGVGSALLRTVLERADDDKLPAYLWTAKERNVPFYQRHGFEVVTAGMEPTSGLKFWTCKRTPRPTAFYTEHQ